MKTVSFLSISVVLTLAFFWFFRFDEGPFISPTNNYGLTASVDQVNYKVHLIVKNKNDEIVDKVNSGANDAQKWAAGWMDNGDTIVLYSSDIGTRAYRMLFDKLDEIELYEDSVKSRLIFKRAKELYKRKYKKN